MNRAYTGLSFGGMYVGDFGNGQNTTNLGVAPDGTDCIGEPQSKWATFVDQSRPVHLF